MGGEVIDEPVNPHITVAKSGDTPDAPRIKNKKLLEHLIEMATAAVAEGETVTEWVETEGELVVKRFNS